VRHRKFITLIGPIFWLLVIIVPTTVGQTSVVEPAASCTSIARIPFEFWIGSSRLPAGNYSLDCILATEVIFRNMQAKTAMETAFLLPTGDEVASNHYKLVFTLHNGQHYLQEVWNSNGRAILTSRFEVNSVPAATRAEVPLIGSQNGANRN
jgi:hypothetical protein